MTILDFVRTTRANLVLLILGIIIGALLGVGYSLTQPKVYAASASGYVTIGSGGTIDVLSGSSAAKDRARSYSAIVSSEAVAKIIQEKNPNMGMTVSGIRGSVTASTDANSSLIKVSAHASTPEHAQVLAPPLNTLKILKAITAVAATPPAAMGGITPPPMLRTATLQVLVLARTPLLAVTLRIISA